MTPERWKQVDKLLEQALEQELDHRALFLDEACEGDTALRQEVESLLAAHEQAASFIEAPVLEVTDRVVPQASARLASGQLLGSYKILSLLGAGGMGEVYRAKDDRIGREVAIKVLKPAFSADPDRLRRFEQEARAAGRLNHPNILALYDVGNHEGSPYIVSELSHGETLRDRLRGKPLPLRKAIDYALQMARGLAAAHEKGIVHRDLKPENLFITTDGRIKILDFGLAKLQPKQGKVTETGIAPLNTEPGLVLGTVGYMSPEQVRGEQTDPRSDIFAFGAIVYEMLSGHRAFQGESAVETMNVILKGEPSDLPNATPPIPQALKHLVRHCLEKSPEQRFQSARDLAFDLEELMGAPVNASEVPVRSAPLKRRELFGWGLAGLSLLVLLTVLLFPSAYFRRTNVDQQTIRFTVNPPEKANFWGSLALSPDGRWLAFIASTTGGSTDGKQSLWLRALDSLAAQELPGTQDAAYPFWSPDSRFIGFFAQRKLKKVAVSGGSPQILAEAPFPAGGTWNRDGIIVFAPSYLDPLCRVSSAGGETTPVTTVNRDQKEAHLFPHFLPDGRRFLYLSWQSPGMPPRDAITVGSVEPKDLKPHVLLAATSGVAYAPPGFLFFMREATLYRQPFDPNRLQIGGEPTPLVEGVAETGGFGYADFSISDNGLAYRRVSPLNTQLTWFNRKGTSLGAVGQPGLYDDLSLSPNDKQVALSLGYPETGATAVFGAWRNERAADIWLIDLLRGEPGRLTFDPRPDYFPVWSPDGSQIVFSSNRNGYLELYLKSSTGAGEDQLLLETKTSKRATDWSRDGRFVVYQEVNSRTNRDLFVLPMFGDRKPRLFLQTEFNERLGRLSPGGAWMAYASNESGKYEIYVQPFPPTGGKWQISINGGHQPSWRSDGKELFYVTDDKTLMAVEVDAAPPNFRTITSKALFQMRAGSDPPYLAAANGQRFLVNTLSGEPTLSTITVVVHWAAGLKP